MKIRSGFIMQAENSGDHLMPPTHPEHSFYAILKGTESNAYFPLSQLPKAKDAHPALKKFVREMLSKWERLPMKNKQIQVWIKIVLGYYQSAYKGKRKSIPYRKDGMFNDPKLDPIANQHRHVGVLFIQQFYPEFVATKAHFKKCHEAWMAYLAVPRKLGRKKKEKKIFEV